jgi:hypothetical protein
MVAAVVVSGAPRAGNAPLLTNEPATASVANCEKLGFGERHSTPTSTAFAVRGVQPCAAVDATARIHKPFSYTPAICHHLFMPNRIAGA